MDSILIIIFALAILSMTAMPFVMKRPAQKKRYQNMQDRDLVACNTKARIMKRRFHFTAYLGAVPIFLLTSVLPKLGFSLCVFGLFIMFGFLVMRSKSTRLNSSH